MSPSFPGPVGRKIITEVEASSLDIVRTLGRAVVANELRQLPGLGIDPFQSRAVTTKEPMLSHDPCHLSGIIGLHLGSAIKRMGQKVVDGGGR